MFYLLQAVRQQCLGTTAGRSQIASIESSERDDGPRHANRVRRLAATAATTAIAAVAAAAAAAAAATAAGWEHRESAHVADLAAAQSSGAHRKDNHHDERSAGLSPWLWHLREGWQGRR